MSRPYLIIPKLIEQPTWGGEYIVTLKGWNDKDFLRGKKIGQSYELFGRSKLALSISDSSATRFVPEVGDADTDTIDQAHFPLQAGTDYISLSDLVAQQPSAVLGLHIIESYGKMPLLIKINQAYGNSFQLHVRADQKSDHWQPKPESWYYLEDGLVTFGLKEGKSVADYKRACQMIEAKMKNLSVQVKANQKTLEGAKKEAMQFIKQTDPWQYVNVHQTHKHDLLDLSIGAVHHSWEENRELCPNGNVVYEVQQDVMDPISTIRSFDQGKFKSDGSIREITIDDYFTYIDTDPAHNNIHTMIQQREGERLLRTSYYALDILEVENKLTQQTNDSFHHLFVRDGRVEIMAGGSRITVGRGHSAFLPADAESYTITSIAGPAVVLKTFIGT